jgi:hypothetical protein
MIDKNAKAPQQSHEELQAERDWFAAELDEARGIIDGLLATLGIEAPHVNISGFADVMAFLTKHPRKLERMHIAAVKLSDEELSILKQGRSPKTTSDGDYHLDKPQSVEGEGDV